MGASKHLIAPKKVSTYQSSGDDRKGVFIPFGVLTDYFNERN